MSPIRAQVPVTAMTDSGLVLLDVAECVRLLHTGRIGRVVVLMGGAAAVLPVNYAMLGSDVLFFTGEGMKLKAALAAATVTFEVDDINVDRRCGWSVLAIGPATVATPGTRARVESLGLYPWAPGDRNHLVRVRPTFLSGRRILTGHEAG